MHFNRNQRFWKRVLGNHLARRVEARFRIDPRKVQELAKIQSDLLDKAAPILKPGGKICYSTCSIQKAENTAVVHDFLQRNPAFALETGRLILPSAEHFDHDGGYVAILHKTANTTERPNQNGRQP
jgi:16S rRNA (cytosine967-C5)-methyltransferase